MTNEQPETLSGNWQIYIINKKSVQIDVKSREPLIDILPHYFFLFIEIFTF